jgi:hypothetical protein
MQLDRTRVAIRERGMLDICDLALRVTREFSPPLIGMLALGILPFAVINWWLIGWMAVDPAPSTFGRYVWYMLLLVYIEAPLATVAATLYLGDAMFLQTPTLSQVGKTLARLAGRLFVCQGLIRGVIPALLLAYTLSPAQFLPADFLLPIIALYLVIMRSTRPYINEIIVLEQNPLFARDSRETTIGRRVARLHGFHAGELMGRYLVSAALCLLLGISVVLGLWFVQGTLLGDWVWSGVMMHAGLPAAMWIVAGYMAVVRYLAYLDLRTRREGWAVELQLRAEGVRLARS